MLKVQRAGVIDPCQVVCIKSVHLLYFPFNNYLEIKNEHRLRKNIIFIMLTDIETAIEDAPLDMWGGGAGGL